MSDNGISGIRNRKQQRASRQAPPPRHPIAATAKADLRRPVEVAESSIGEPEGNSLASAEAPSSPAARPSSTRAATAIGLTSRVKAAPSSEPPDLTIDWTDASMHVVRPTRISVANSVAARFKAAADAPQAAPQTELIMDAVEQQLRRLPELVLARRPGSKQPEAGFFLRRGGAANEREPWVSVYLRPNAGEIEALRRIVEWVSAVITAHPGRKETSRSEVVTAALDATYRASRRGV